jgi:cysteinyl-tRNA synthetase
MQLVMNITDVDDKIIVHSHREGVGFSEFARKWEKDFF